MSDSVARIGDPTVVDKDPVAMLSEFGVWANRRVDSYVEIFAARYGADKRHSALAVFRDKSSNNVADTVVDAPSSVDATSERMFLIHSFLTATAILANQFFGARNIIVIPANVTMTTGILPQ